MKNEESILRIEQDPSICPDCNGIRVKLDNAVLPIEMQKGLANYPEVIVLSCEKCKTHTFVLDQVLI